MKKLFAIICLLFTLQNSFAQEEIWMHPNKGQWHPNIEYKINIPGGQMYLEKSGFTYNFSNFAALHNHTHDPAEEHDHDEDTFRGHAIKTKFIGANSNPVFETLERSAFYENYLIGNDPSKWASNVYAYQQVNYLSLYDGIDLHLYESNATLKYDLIVHPGYDPGMFMVEYEGAESVQLTEKGILIRTSLGDILEGSPIAFQIINDQKKEVRCEYHLENNRMSFVFPEGYDPAYELVIDPELSFSTFTGSSSDNWGMTACPDQNKNMVAAGIVFGTGYPTNAGAYDSSFNGGGIDIGITKFTNDGSGIVFSTYIGGNESETPNSVIVDNNNNIILMGATSSTNFPVSFGAHQNNLKPGGTESYGTSFAFTNGVDLYITKLSSDGGTLVASTYYGGTATEGTTYDQDAVIFNYGDGGRGEVDIDDQNNIYISSYTESNDIAIVGGFQTTKSGTKDAIVAKFSPDLTTLMWSTYLGGSGIESGPSVEIAPNGDIFVAGGTTSSNFPGTSGQLNSGYLGGTCDGYITKFEAPAYSTVRSTYLGTGDYDQVYFVQLDLDNYVYVLGQTRGNYAITGSVYNNPGSGQFIHKLSNDLTTTEWSTSVGSSSGNEEISPTAFLVSDCYEIYFSGWGGAVNQTNAPNSSTAGLPITADAYQSSTSGSNFYLASFSADMGDILYGTYMGNINGNGDHVDGGTSRFHKDGTVYHAVCAACGGNSNGFPTTPGVFSESNNSSNCNLAAFVFELGQLEASLSIPSPLVCIPNSVNFENDSENGNTYYWEFGDGETSTEFQPIHYYQTPGDYTAMLVVSDSAGCYSPDTAYVDVTIQLLEAEAGTLSDTICPGSSVQLYAIGGDTYEWGPADLLDDPTAAEPIATIDEETTFTVTVWSECGTSELEVTVYVFGADAAAGQDTAICVGGDAQLFAGGGDSYAWSPSNSLDDPNSGTPIASPIITTTYVVTIITPEGCEIKDTTKVVVDQDIPYPNLANQVAICEGETIQILAGGATDYLWSPNYNISAIDVFNPFVWPADDFTYHVAFTNACGTSYDSVFVDVIHPVGYINPDTTICPEGSATLYAEGGVSYYWSPNYHIDDERNKPVIEVSPPQETTYTVTITDQYGCQLELSTNVDVFESPVIQVSSGVYAIIGDTVGISANGSGDISWSPDYNISCIECEDAFVWPNVNYVYTATVTDENGCTNSASVPIHYDPIIFVPNAFTPNGDAYNNTFKAEGYNIQQFEMYIFNRWGELIYTMTDIDQSWDGSYNGVLVLDDVYIWVVKYVDLNNQPYELRGHVTVLK